MRNISTKKMLNAATATAAATAATAAPLCQCCRCGCLCLNRGSSSNIMGVTVCRCSGDAVAAALVVVVVVVVEISSNSIPPFNLTLLNFTNLTFSVVHLSPGKSCGHFHLLHQPLYTTSVNQDQAKERDDWFFFSEQNMYAWSFPIFSKSHTIQIYEDDMVQAWVGHFVTSISLP